MGLFSSLFSNKAGIKRAKEAAGAMQHAAITGMEAVDRERARGIASEQAKMSVFGLLGSDPNTFTTGAKTGSTGDPTNLFTRSGAAQPNQSLYGMAKYDKHAGELLGKPREGILDPEAYAAAISNTASFRIQSKRVRESEELLNQEGPAWDMLSNSVLGTINEGSALQLRDTMRKLKNQYAKGGSARRTAMFEANELMAGERAMRTRVQETWQANLALYDTVRQNADRVAAGTATFMAGLPLVNDSYRDAMQRTASMQIQASSMAAQASMEAYRVRETQKPVNFLKNFIEGTIKSGPAIIGGAIDSYLGKKGGGSGGGGGVAGGMSMPFNTPGAGYTPMGGTAGSYGGGTDYSQLVSDTGSMLKSGADWMNQRWGDNENDSPVGPYASDYKTDGWDIDRGSQTGDWDIDRG